MWDKSQLWWAHQSIQHPWARSHFLASLGGLKKKWQDSRGLVQQCGAVVVCYHPLNCHPGGLSRLVSTFFPGRKCTHICKGIYWWWINGSLTHHGKDTVTASPFVSLFSCVGPCAQFYELIQSFNSWPLFCVNGCQIKWLRQTETWNQCPERGSHPHPTKWPEWPWRSRGIWECPISITIPDSGKETQLPWDSVLFRDTGDFHWGQQSDTTTISCMAGTNHGRYGLRRQSWPNRSCSDWPRKGYPILWTAIISRRTEPRGGKRCHIYVVRSNCMGW